MRVKIAVAVILTVLITAVAMPAWASSGGGYATPANAATPSNATPTAIGNAPGALVTPIVLAQGLSGSGQQQGVATPAAVEPVLRIDSVNIYDGMTSSYYEGYEPVSRNGIVTIVLPLIEDVGNYGAFKSESIRAAPNLGDTESSPFRFKNYEKTFMAVDHPLNFAAGPGGTAYYGTAKCFLVRFDLELSPDRTRGRYPVKIDVSAALSAGGQFEDTYTVYVNVDGKDPNEPSPTPSPSPSPTPKHAPKLILGKAVINPSPAVAGEPFKLTATLENTSEKQPSLNIKVTVKGETTDIIPAGETSTYYIASIGKGKSAQITADMEVRSAAEAKPAKVLLTIEYEDADGVAISANEEVIVEINQPIRLEFDEPNIPKEVNAGDNLPFSINVMNMGKSMLYNVRVQLDAPGLIPEGSAFVGNLESGKSAAAEMYVFVGTLDMTATPDGATNAGANDSKYGYTSGTVTITYEDEYGSQYSETADIETIINAPVIAPAAAGPEEEKPDTASQWWISVIVLGVIAAALIVFFTLKKRKKPRRYDYHEE